MLAMVDWTTVIVSVVTAFPATIGALAALSNRRALRTPSGPSVGKQAESANALSAVTLANLIAFMKRHGHEPVSHEDVLREADEAVNSIPGEKPSTTLEDA